MWLQARSPIDRNRLPFKYLYATTMKSHFAPCAFFFFVCLFAGQDCARGASWAPTIVLESPASPLSEIPTSAQTVCVSAPRPLRPNSHQPEGECAQGQGRQEENNRLINTAAHRIYLVPALLSTLLVFLVLLLLLVPVYLPSTFSHFIFSLSFVCLSLCVDYLSTLL